MEQIQRYFVRFKIDTLDIISMGQDAWHPEEGCAVIEVEWDTISPFFGGDYSKSPVQYYPVIDNGKILNFRRKSIYESSIVVNTDEDVVQSLRSFENFIADCKILVQLTDDAILLIYDKQYFDPMQHQENIDRLTLAQDIAYNITVTQKGDPFTIYETAVCVLNLLLENKTITIPYTGPKDISVYIIKHENQ
jgi:hypothetical protein